MAQLDVPDRFYMWHRKVHWTCWTRYEQYLNDLGDQMWHCWEEWAVFVGLKPKLTKWFGY